MNVGKDFIYDSINIVWHNDELIEMYQHYSLIMRYHEIVLDHFHHPRHVGCFNEQGIDVGVARMGSYEHGIVLQLHIQVSAKSQHIQDVCFKAYGPVPIIAVGSFISDWLIGRTLTDAEHLTSTEIAQLLKLPAVTQHCAALGESVIKNAINDYVTKQSKS